MRCSNAASGCFRRMLPKHALASVSNGSAAILCLARHGMFRCDQQCAGYEAARDRGARGPRPSAGVITANRFKTTKVAEFCGYERAKKVKGRKRQHLHRTLASRLPPRVAALRLNHRVKLYWPNDPVLRANWCDTVLSQLNRKFLALCKVR